MARTFNASPSNTIGCGNHAVLRTTGNLSMAAWVYFNVNNVEQDFIFYDNGFNSFSAAYSLRARPLSTFNLQLETANGSANFDVNGTTTIATGIWTHLGSSFNGTTATLYVQGVSDGGAQATTAPAYSGTSQIGLTVGAFHTNANGVLVPLNGNMADVAIWSTNLTAGEMLALAKGARPGNIRTGSLLFWAPLDGLASPEPDYSGNSFNGTISGTVPQSTTAPPMMMFTPRWPQSISAAVASTVAFRKSLSQIGGRVGARQRISF